MSESLSQDINENLHNDPNPSDIAHFLLDETGWVAVAFVAFALLFLFKVWPKIAEALDGRTKAIEEQLRQAAELKEEAQAILAESERKAAEAEQAAKDMIETAKADSKQMIVNAEQEIEKEIEEKTSLAKQKIKRAEAQAIDNVRDQAVDAAIAAAAELIQKEVSKGSKKDALVKDSLKVISGSIK